MRNFKAAILAIAFACGTATAAEPIINTIAGGGTTNADGIPATQAILAEPHDIALDAAGNLYIAEMCRIRKVGTNGVITTIAGNGANATPTPTNGQQATSGAICSKTVGVDPFGYVYYAWAGRIGKISPTGVVTFVAGTGTDGYSGDGGPATSAKIYSLAISDIIFDAVGNAFIADSNRIRKIATNGIITTFAGNGSYTDNGNDGDYGPATAAAIDPEAIAFDRFGNLYIANAYHWSVRKIDTTGMITPIWGRWPQYRSDPIALGTDAYYPAGLATDAAGNLYVGNRANFVSVLGPNNAIKHIVGTFNDTTWDELGYGALQGFSGDGGPALAAQLRFPEAIALDAQGNLYIADKGNNRIRKVTGPLPTPDPLPSGAHAFEHATPPHWVSANQYTVGVVKGEADADGRTDLFVLAGSWDRLQPYPGDWTLNVYRQTPDGALAAPVSYPVHRIDLSDVMAIDLNHDRYTDIVYTGIDVNNVYSGVYVMLGGANGMAAPVRYAGINGANRATSLQQADMNRDGHMDVLAYLSTGGDGGSAFSNWAIYFSNGTGALVDKKLTPVLYSHASLVHDFNDDGWPDMLFGWSTPDDSGLSVAYHDGLGNFHPQTMYPSGFPGRGGFHPAVADFNRDGVEDIILTGGENAPRAKFTHWIRKPGGGFEYVAEWKTYDIPETLIAEDMNKDGRKDLLVKHAGWDAIGYLQQARRSDGTWWLDREVKAYAHGSNAATMHSTTVGDFNSDGCRDIAITYTNAGLQIQYGTCLTVALRPVANDYDGDGRSDILWRNTTNGTNAVWRSGNHASQLPVTGVTNVAWKIVGEGDFDHDGKDDIVWRNTSSGANALWRSGNSATQLAMPAVSLSWSIVGVGDFDGDGADDLLWRNGANGANAVWRSGNSTTQLPVTGVTNLQWHVVGVGDFDGDGKSDILWRNTTTGINAIWRSANNATQLPVMGVTNLTWKVQGVGDFDADGRADLLWRNASSGVNTIWNGARNYSQRAVASVSGSQWKVAAVGDYDGDGSDDLLWRNVVDGRNGVWRSGDSATQITVVGVTNGAWTVVPYTNQP